MTASARETNSTGPFTAVAATRTTESPGTMSPRRMDVSNNMAIPAITTRSVGSTLCTVASSQLKNSFTKAEPTGCADARKPGAIYAAALCEAFFLTSRKSAIAAAIARESFTKGFVAA